MIVSASRCLSTSANKGEKSEVDRTGLKGLAGYATLGFHRLVCYPQITLNGARSAINNKAGIDDDNDNDDDDGDDNDLFLCKTHMHTSTSV